MLMSGLDKNAPYGAEKFEWNPIDKTFKTAWGNKKISIPNGIPCMSAATHLVYVIGQGRMGAWSFETLDWDTGQRVFSFRYGRSSMYNSAYAATEIGLDGSLITGALLGAATMISGK